MLRPILAAAVFTVSAAMAAEAPGTVYPSLPKGVSSFGAVECDGFIYVYGGHAGKAHTYSTESNLGSFQKLPIGGGTKWEALPGGPSMQGLNLAAAGGKIYRVGGMVARNKPNEKQDLHSIATVAVFDPKANKWSDGVALPVGRSSHDVVGVGTKLVVVGGWKMQTPEKPEWADTAFVLDTAAATPRWESAQPFKRRALTAAALGTKVYVIGGLTESGESVRKVEVYDFATGKWSEGPEFPGTDRVGFSPAATVAGGKLVLSTSDKNLHVLNEKGTAWEKAGTIGKARLVHRLVPGGKETVVAIAGAGGMTGPLNSVEVAKLGEVKTAAAANDDPKVQKYCPIMTNDEIDLKASKTVEYKGVKIYVCCDQCIGKFNRDPAAYLDPKFIPALAGLELPKRDIEQMYCPVAKDRKISSKDPSTTYKGVKIYFYNDIARQRFEKDPERYADPKVLPQLPKK